MRSDARGDEPDLCFPSATHEGSNCNEVRGTGDRYPDSAKTRGVLEACARKARGVPFESLDKSVHDQLQLSSWAPMGRHDAAAPRSRVRHASERARWDATYALISAPSGRTLGLVTRTPVLVQLGTIGNSG